MGNVEYWIMAQIALEAILLAGVVIFLFTFRKWRQRKSDPQEIQAILEKSHLLKDELLDTLQARKTIISNLVKQLDQKATEAQMVLKTLERRVALAGGPSLPSGDHRVAESVPALRERVEILHDQGLSQDQIASQLQISRGEVMLILDLMKVESR